MGWTVEDDGARNHLKVIKWTLTPPENTGNHPPQHPQNRDSCGDAGTAWTEYCTSQARLDDQRGDAGVAGMEYGTSPAAIDDDRGDAGIAWTEYCTSQAGFDDQ